MQTITLKGYGTNIPPYEAIELGTYDSYGVEQLQIVPAHGWENLSIIASFFPPYGAEPIKVAVLSSGIIDVPPGATAKQSGKGIIVFAGYKANTQLISANVAYNIRDHKDIASGDPVCPTPSVVDQIVNAAKAAQEGAEKAAQDASEAKTSANKSQENAEKAQQAAEKAAADAAKAGPYAESALAAAKAAKASEANAAASAKKAQDVADSLPEDYTTTVNDIATLKQQVANITPDDSTVGEKPWSSKNIVDMLCPPIEESGNPVQCYPVENYPLGVKVSWTLKRCRTATQRKQVNPHESI